MRRLLLRTYLPLRRSITIMLTKGVALTFHLDTPAAKLVMPTITPVALCSTSAAAP